MNYSLKDLLDIPRLRELLDALDEIYSMPFAIIDTEGNILTATGWQEICTKFHWVNPETEKMCVVNTKRIDSMLGEKLPHVLYRCPLGLVDTATPIVIEGNHLGNVFTCQLFIDPPDESFFINQARKYAFDEAEYLAAIRKVPQLSEEQLHKKLNFIGKLAQMLAEQGLQAMRQHEATNALQQSEQNFLSIVDAVPIPFALNDENGNVTFLNRAFVQTVGYTLNDIPTLKEWWLRAYPDPHYRQLVTDNWQINLDEANRTCCPFTPMEVNIKCENNSIRTFMCSASALEKDFTGTHLVAFYDITERKQAEEERFRLEAQLYQAQKIESIGRLAGGVAHDFNNMLSVILGHTEMILMHMNDPCQPIYSSLMEIKKAADRSADLTRQLLAFARKQTVTPKVINLNEAVAGMLSMLQRLLGENVHLTWKPTANLSPVRMDSSQIDQIMANLCVNARDAIADVGEIIIETGDCCIDVNYCTAHPCASPGDYVKIVVSDDGKGMDKETLDHIFEPFFTTKGVGEGTGLGLATVYGIVRQNNGFINVYSESETGTTFTIYLPRYEGNPERAQTEGSAESLQHGHETILLVEDEPAILEMTIMILKEFGYNVLPASTPGEAIRTAREYTGEIDLLMTDVIMPEMNGQDLAKNLLSIYPHIKCLFMSGYTADIIAHHGVLNEGVHFIQKPFQMNALAARLREVLDGK